MSQWHPVVKWIVGILTVLVAAFVMLLVLGSVRVEAASRAWVQRGQIVAVDSYENVVPVASANPRVRCSSHWSYKRGRSIIGTMFWIQVTKTWCSSVRSHRVVFAPAPTIRHEVTQAGALMQWDDKGVNGRIEGFYPYRGWMYGAHRSWVQVYFKRCLPSPFGCVPFGSANIAAQVIGNYDGSYRTG